MIRLPERSVTRFFIPLIDVLILLFCIYLIMPIVQGPADAAAEGAGEGNPPLSVDERRELERLRGENQELQRRNELSEPDRLELQRLERREHKPLEQRLTVRVVEIDPTTGKLIHYDPNRVEISNEAAARAMIERHKREAADRELYYLFLLPRRPTGYPEERQVQQYQRWFADVPTGFDQAQANP